MFNNLNCATISLKSISASAPAGYTDIQSQQIVPPKKSGKKFSIIIAVVIALTAASVDGFFIVKNLTSGSFKGSIAVYSAEEGGMMFSGTEPDGRAYAGVFRLKLTNNSEFTTEMYQMQYFVPDGESMTYGSDLAKLLVVENLKETIDDYAIAHNEDLENYNREFSKITGFDGTLEKQSDTEYELWAYGECLNMTVTPK